MRNGLYFGIKWKWTNILNQISLALSEKVFFFFTSAFVHGIYSKNQDITNHKLNTDSLPYLTYTKSFITHC